MTRPLLLLLSVVLVACDRQGPEAPTSDRALGTFAATVRQVGGGGFETLEGTATVAITGGSSPGVTVRLASPVGGSTDTTTLDLSLAVTRLPGLGDTEIGDLSEPATDAATVVALCYRSPLFQDGPYRSASGTLTVTEAGPAVLAGEIDATAYADLPTGPATSTRVRVEVEGVFRAAVGEVGVLPEAVRRCD